MCVCVSAQIQPSCIAAYSKFYNFHSQHSTKTNTVQFLYALSLLQTYIHTHAHTLLYILTAGVACGCLSSCKILGFSVLLNSAEYTKCVGSPLSLASLSRWWVQCERELIAQRFFAPVCMLVFFVAQPSVGQVNNFYVANDAKCVVWHMQESVN